MNYLIYLVIIAAITIIVGTFYLMYWRRVTSSSTTPGEKVYKITPEPSGDVSATQNIAPPMVSELSSLPEDAKNKLKNAIWYRCENPYCNYTQFLDVHHILSEVEGGTNRPDNLIVLCSRCHTAALNGEISVKELRSWIQERTERFRTDLDWPYK